MNDAIVLKDVTKRYQDFTLNHISFTLPSGCVMGLVGENGAGKTTTLKLILNLIKRDEGTISLLGADNISQELEIKEQIGVVFDECCFPMVLSPFAIGKVLSKCYRQWDGKAYEHYLSEWNIPKEKVIKDFSRGMKTKLSIAAALSHHPKLLILDEATSGLDPMMRSDILDCFRGFICDDEHSILLSSHITSDLERIADYITFLHHGEVLFSQDKDSLLETYGIAKCSISQMEKIPKEWRIGVRKNEFGCEILIRDISSARRAFPDMVIDKASLDEVITLSVKGELK